MKGDIGRYVNEGHDAINGEQLKTAMASGQGTTGAKSSYVAEIKLCWLKSAFHLYMTEELNCARNYSATLSRVTTN